MSPALTAPTLWDGERQRANDRLEPIWTEIAYRDGRVVALRKAYRVKGSLEYNQRPASRQR